MNDLMTALSSLPDNAVIADNFVKAWSYINEPSYENIICAISGGSDSDIVLDICVQCDKARRIEYVWFDTGLEYAATKEHLRTLEAKYGIKIKAFRAKKPIPLTCKNYGQPFISKRVSEYIERLQRHNFAWEDESFDVLYARYPECKAALRWWCNAWGEGSKFNIAYNKGLKPFIIAQPPKFKISNKCCKYAKKDVLKACLTQKKYDLNIYGVRKAEGGARSSSYKSCFSCKLSTPGPAEYRPIFWYKDQDKKDYEHARHIEHSACYSEYGLSRTGCAGCPFGKDFEAELAVMQKYEPALFTAVNNIFADSYAYTRAYKAYLKTYRKD